MRFDHLGLLSVARTRRRVIRHFPKFPRNLAPNFTHYFSERPEVTSQQRASLKLVCHETSPDKKEALRVSLWRCSFYENTIATSPVPEAYRQNYEVVYWLRHEGDGRTFVARGVAYHEANLYITAEGCGSPLR